MKLVTLVTTEEKYDTELSVVPALCNCNCWCFKIKLSKKKKK